MASVERLEGYYHFLDRVEMTWNFAEELYSVIEPEILTTPWTSEAAKSDWKLLESWVMNATGDNRTNPGSEKLQEFKEAAKNILRRLLGRRQGLSGDALAPAPTRDAFLDGFHSTFGFGLGGGKKTSQTARFCRCIKSVRKTIRPRKGSTKESAAIGVCVKSVLHRRGKTLKKFKCARPSRLSTQKRK
jgi:hypothetical protein